MRHLRAQLANLTERPLAYNVLFKSRNAPKPIFRCPQHVSSNEAVRSYCIGRDSDACLTPHKIGCIFGIPLIEWLYDYDGIVVILYSLSIIFDSSPFHWSSIRSIPSILCLRPYRV